MENDQAIIHPSVEISPGVSIGINTQVWHLSQIREGANIGSNCTIGRSVYIGPGVVCGDNCKIQNHALLYEPAVLGQGVFIGPAVVLTNDLHPRAVTPNGLPKGPEDWEKVGIRILEGASIGARSVCVAPLTIGKWAMIGAGSVVTKDVPDHALVVGNPARQIGWVCRCGRRLQPRADMLICSSCLADYPNGPSGLASKARPS